MRYDIDFTSSSEKDISKLKSSEPQAYKKLVKLLIELQEHPGTGTGHPKPLGGDKTEQWSRRITAKHRLIYIINEDTTTVLVLSAYGHYDDK